MDLREYNKGKEKLFGKKREWLGKNEVKFSSKSRLKNLKIEGRR